MNGVGSIKNDLARSGDGRGRTAAPPWWVLVSAGTAPLVLIAGWIVAGAMQEPGYSAAEQSVSTLAGLGARNRLVMTTALAVVGCAHIVTASGLWGIRPTARILLGLSGLSVIAVAAFPEPPGGSTTAHLAAASASAILLTAWVVFTGDATRGGPLSVVGSLWAAGVIAGTVLVMFTAGQVGTDFGLAERICTAVQCLWPLVVVTALRWSAAAAPPDNPMLSAHQRTATSAGEVSE